MNTQHLEIGRCFVFDFRILELYTTLIHKHLMLGTGKQLSSLFMF